MASKSREKFEVCSRSSINSSRITSSSSAKSVLSKKLAEKESWRNFDGGSSRYSLDSKKSEHKPGVEPRVERRVNAIVVPKDRSRSRSNSNLEIQDTNDPLEPRNSRRKVVFCNPRLLDPQKEVVEAESVEVQTSQEDANPRRARAYPCQEKNPDADLNHHDDPKRAYWKWILLALATALVVGLAYKKYAK